MRFAAMLVGHCCNRHQIFIQQRPQGDLFKTQFRITLKFNFQNQSFVAGLDVFQIPAQQQAVDVRRKKLAQQE